MRSVRFWLPAIMKYSLCIFFGKFLHTVALVSIHVSVKIVPWSKVWSFVPLETEQVIWWPYDELHGLRFFFWAIQIRKFQSKWNDFSRTLPRLWMKYYNHNQNHLWFHYQMHMAWMESGLHTSPVNPGQSWWHWVDTFTLCLSNRISRRCFRGH